VADAVKQRIYMEMESGEAPVIKKPDGSAQAD